MEEFDRELMKKKLDPLLMDIVTQTGATVPLIVQTIDGLKDEDRAKVAALGGKVKDDLYIINAFSAEMSTDAVLEIIKSDRIVRIYYDAEVRAM
jgi:hypothetical protein